MSVISIGSAAKKVYKNVNFYKDEALDSLNHKQICLMNDDPQMDGDDQYDRPAKNQDESPRDPKDFWRKFWEALQRIELVLNLFVLLHVIHTTFSPIS